MNFEIRHAKPEDALQIFELNELFNGVGSTSLDKLTKSLIHNKQEIVLIAVMDNTIIGFICGQIFKSMCYDTYYGEISELFVIEKFRRQGIGAALISRIEEEFKENNIYSFQLFTGASNISAQKFYECQGYHKTEEWMYRKRI